MKIPKIIHLCWFGRGTYPALAEICIQSWKKFLPDYEIKVWNEDTFDVNSCSYTKAAYEAKKWAFVTDYVRLFALQQYGGVYMDTDLEVLRDFTPLLEGKGFVGSYIEGGLISAGILASVAAHPFVSRLLSYYQGEADKIDLGEPIDFVMNPLIFTEIAVEEYGFSLRDTIFSQGDMIIYPLEYFMPYKKLTFGSKFGHWRFKLSDQTYAIHHDMSSWHKRNPVTKFVKDCVRLLLPQKLYLSMKINKNEAAIRGRK